MTEQESICSYLDRSNRNAFRTHVIKKLRHKEEEIPSFLAGIHDKIELPADFTGDWRYDMWLNDLQQTHMTFAEDS